MNFNVHQRAFAYSYNSYFNGSSIQRISFYLDRKPPGALVMLKNLKSWLHLTVKKARSLVFHIFNFQFRVLQFVARNQREIIERAEILTTFLNFKGVHGGEMVKFELRFDKEVISSEWMDDINRMFQYLLETGRLGQMTFSELQVRVSISSLTIHSDTLMNRADFAGEPARQSVVERIAAFCKRSQWSLWSGSSGRNS